jgi:hypothetical protein
MDEAVDWAAETRPCANCEMSFSASLTDESLETFFTADVKLFHVRLVFALGRGVRVEARQGFDR